MLTHFEAWTALLFSGVAPIVSLRVQRKQSMFLDRQIKNADDDAHRRLEANIASRVERRDSWPGRGVDYWIVIENLGPADARDVDLLFKPDQSPLPEGEHQEKLPARILQPTGKVDLIAAVSGPRRPPFYATLRWQDGSGLRSREVTLG